MPDADAGGRLGWVIDPRWGFLRQIGGLGQFHLDGVKSLGRAAIVSGGPAALEPSVDHVAVAICLRGTIGEHLDGAPDIKMLQPVVAGDPAKGQLRP